jgi:hypothetical protein
MVEEEQLEELEYRVTRLEELLFGGIKSGNDITIDDCGEDFVAWNKLTSLDRQLSSFERLLNSTSVKDQNVGTMCMAFSIADEKWVEAEIEDKPSLDTMIISYSGLKRREECQNLRPLHLDFAAITRAEDFLQQTIQSSLSSSNEIEANVSFPYAIPLSIEAQHSIVQQSKAELEVGSDCLGTLFREPDQLVKYVDSEAIRSFPEVSVSLEQLDAKHSKLIKEAQKLRDDTKQFIDR